jgi:mannose-6-phosphate isomerase-like protein (cupin superfamily)
MILGLNTRRTAAGAVVALSLLAGGVGIGVAVSAGAAEDPVVVTRQSLAEVKAPPGAPKRTLGLSKVVVMPGAVLAAHHHPGDQIAYIAEGVLTYTVEDGRARVMKGPGDDGTLVRKLTDGETARLRPGRWIIEDQDMRHRARNKGTVPVVIYLATLLRTGEPAAIPD